MGLIDFGNLHRVLLNTAGATPDGTRNNQGFGGVVGPYKHRHNEGQALGIFFVDKAPAELAHGMGFFATNPA